MGFCPSPKSILYCSFWLLAHFPRVTNNHPLKNPPQVTSSSTSVCHFHLVVIFPPTEISVLADHAKLEPDIEDINFLPTAMFCSKAGGIRKDSGCRKCGGRNVRLFPKKDEKGSISIGNESSKLRQLTSDFHLRCLRYLRYLGRSFGYPV